MKLETEQLLGTLELLNEPLQIYEGNIGGGYTLFDWDASIKGEFNLWNLMKDEKYIQNISPKTAISQWILDEWLHPIAPQDRYSPPNSKGQTFLDVDSKVKRYKAFKNLYELLNSSLEALEAFTIMNYLCVLIGRINHERWIVISPSAPHRQDFPYWITYSNLEIEKNNTQRTTKLQSTVKKLLETLTPLQLAIYGIDGYGYNFDYYYSYAFAETKIEAFIQSLNMTKIVQSKRFISLSSDYNQYLYNGDKRRKAIYVLNKFFQQRLSNTNIYYFTMYDCDNTYIVGETSDKDWLGIKISRSYRYY